MGGDINTTVYVDYKTVDGSANAGSDYTHVEDTAVFKPGETLCTISVPILDDDIFEEDEFFKVELSNVRFGGQDGNTDFSKIRLDSPSVGTVVILDDDGVLEFNDDETSKFIKVTIVDDEEYEKNKM